MKQLRNELEAKFGKNFNIFSDVIYDELIQLPFLDAVIQETLRMQPPARFIFRQMTCDTEIDGYQISNGDIFLIPLLYYQNCVETHGENFNTFDHQRFIDGKFDSGCDHAPFATANRMCIGKNLVYLNLKVMAMVLATQKFKVKVDDAHWKKYFRDILEVKIKVSTVI